MMRSTRVVAVCTAWLGVGSMVFGGCLFDDPGSSSEDSDEMHPPAGTDCMADYAACADAVAESGEDPALCEPILASCHDVPPPPDPAVDECYAAFDACLCDPMTAEAPWICEEQLDACLRPADPCIHDVDPCAGAFEACMMESGAPEMCEPLLRECEVPPEEDCMSQYGRCVEETGDPAVCEDLLTECFAPPPPEPDHECLLRFEECVSATMDPELCQPILDECRDVPMDEPPPEDPGMPAPY